MIAEGRVRNVGEGEHVVGQNGDLVEGVASQETLAVLQVAVDAHLDENLEINAVDPGDEAGLHSQVLAADLEGSAEQFSLVVSLERGDARECEQRALLHAHLRLAQLLLHQIREIAERLAVLG